MNSKWTHYIFFSCLILIAYKKPPLDDAEWDSVFTWVQHQGLALLAGVEAIARGVSAERHEGGHLPCVIILMLETPHIVGDKTIRVRGDSHPVSFPQNASEALFILQNVLMKCFGDCLYFSFSFFRPY